MYVNFDEAQFTYKMNARWRQIFYITCAVLALLGTITEVVIFLIDAQKGAFFLPTEQYLTRFLYIPSGLNVVVLIISWIFTSRTRTSDNVKNYATCGLIFFLCANTEVIHYVYAPLLCLPCIAIFMSVLFVDKRLTLCITIASFVSLGIAAYMGATELRSNDPQLFTDVGLAALITMLAYVGVRLVSKFTIQQREYILSSLERQAELIRELKIDPLTKLYNRAALEQKLSQANSDVKSCLMIVDLDNFKKVNDTYGHICGDEVLMRFSALASELCKGYPDRVNAYRYGGEEFVIAFDDMEPIEAEKLADRLRQRFSAEVYSFKNKKPITFSGGVSVTDGVTEQSIILERADTALYASKENGRNRITFWSKDLDKTETLQ